MILTPIVPNLLIGIRWICKKIAYFTLSQKNKNWKMINIIIEVLKNASKNSYFCPFCPPWDAQGGHFALLPPPVHAPESISKTDSLKNCIDYVMYIKNILLGISWKHRIGIK